MLNDAKPIAPRAESATLSRRSLLRRAARGVIAVPALLGLKAPPAAALPATNTFIMAQLQYRGGHWDPRPLAIAPLMQEMRQRTSVETQNERRALTLRDPALFSHPFLYMTGEQAFEPFDTEELEILRRYLRFGGLMLIDDARGNKGQDFDASVRREIARLFPGRSLKILSPDHSVFRTYTSSAPSAACASSIPTSKASTSATAPRCSTARTASAPPGSATTSATGCPPATPAAKPSACKPSSSASTPSCTPSPSTTNRTSSTCPSSAASWAEAGPSVGLS